MEISRKIVKYIGMTSLPTRSQEDHQRKPLQAQSFFTVLRCSLSSLLSFFYIIIYTPTVSITILSNQSLPSLLPHWHNLLISTANGIIACCHSVESMITHEFGVPASLSIAHTDHWWRCFHIRWLIHISFFAPLAIPIIFIVFITYYQLHLGLLIHKCSWASNEIKY